MGEGFGGERGRRAIGPVAALVAMLIALGVGAAWTAAATVDQQGHEVDMPPVIDDGLLGSSTPTSRPDPTPTPDEPSVPAPVPQPVPAPPPADIDDDDDGDDGDDADDD